jgi:hypothetical protein
MSVRLWFFLLVATAVGSGQGSPAKADAALEGVHPAQWRLVWTSDPATSAVLCWNTVLPGQQHRVHLHRFESGGATAAATTEQQVGPEDLRGEAAVIAAQRNGRYSATRPELYYHHAHLSDLQPATKYRVVLESDGQRSPPLFFVTAPSDDVPVSLLFGADSRSGQQARRQMNAMMAKMLAESYAAQRVPILALAHGGDFIRDGRELDQWSRWMSDHELTVTADGQLLPIIPARGNHDGGELFNEVFAFPADDANYYSLDLGPQVRLVTLNTETSMSGDQRNWLQAELAAARPKRRWLVAQYHRPAFPAVKVPALSLVHWVPLFEEFNVDLVCEGDGHNIKRTAPIRDFHIDPTGVVYIGEGGLGVGQRTPKPGRWYLNSTQAKIGEGHHVQLLTFDQTQLSYRVVLLGGAVFDEHFLSVRRPLPGSDPGGNPE